MTSPTRPQTDLATKNPAISALFHQAMASGRTTLDPTELGRLLASLGLAFAADASQAAQSGAIEVSIKLYHTREFGMIISAGTGGLDAQLDADNFKKDRAVVHAATELTTAETFLNLFHRTYILSLIHI